MSSLSIYNTFNISPGKQAYLCSINDFWASRLKLLARTNYLPLNERLFKINLREGSNGNINQAQCLNNYSFCKSSSSENARFG
jgi:hypothetical protein